MRNSRRVFVLYYADDIMRYRQEFLDLDDSLSGKGYAKEMLCQNLKNCKAFGLDKVL